MKGGGGEQDTIRLPGEQRERGDGKVIREEEEEEEEEENQK